MNRPQANHFRRHLYILKRKWPVAVDLYHEGGEVLNLATGERTVEALKYSVRRAISLPRKVTQNNTLAIALKEIWSRGSKIETADRQILIDRRDLPKGLEVGTENWYTIIEEKRYQIVSLEDYEGLAYVLMLKSTTGAPRYAQVEIRVNQRVSSDEEVTHDP